MSLPLLGGEGVHPPADACDYARYCAGLDFWSINDHAEGISPQHWRETVDSIQRCNAATDPTHPDTVAFLGWEWSQVGSTPETHFGHKNVVLLGTDPDEVPRRPIAAPRPEFRVATMPTIAKFLLPLAFFAERQRYFDYFEYINEVEATPQCDPNTNTRDLPAECHEVARDPRELFRKLDEWGGPALVIPHGTSWGLMTPAGSSWDLQATEGQHDPQRQNLFEIYSGHGNSEEYRSWRAVELGPDGEQSCPEPTGDGYEACCWRAGEIIRSRCVEDIPSQVCEQRVEDARRNYLEAGVGAHNSVPGATVLDWGNCGQCPDCFAPAFTLRPEMSGQYALARGFRFGFLGSSDNHSARAGNGFKEHARLQLTEARPHPTGIMAKLMGGQEEPSPESIQVDVSALPLQKRRDVRRSDFLLTTGGLAAVHSEGRSRDQIWDAWNRREVYGTSGPRILLWFNLMNGPEGSTPMGSEASLDETAPRFRVRAAGSREQLPGCPQHVGETLTPERIAKLCLNECHHPGDARLPLDRIEVVRITPGPMETAPQIEDPWRSFSCEGQSLCTIEFDDTEPVAAERAYYVRAIQTPTPAVGAGGFRCVNSSNGECSQIRPCTGEPEALGGSDCLSEVGERAWSSPIFVTRALEPRGVLQ
ncbi:DUF3604 domain-containing protein [Myxococcota bacterium]|nr:DUF3604 domain-containing protein [Myxococcota bacterium]